MHTTDIILNAARQRFSDYGPGKTTMAEIAADCDMSVGNLYRHFDNKQAIMVASMQQQLQKKLQAGMTAAAQQHDGLDALRCFLQTRLHLAHAQFAGTRHLFDLLHIIESHHREVLLDYEQQVITAMAEIIQKGIECGQFSHPDPMQLAYDIHQACLRYNHPITLQNHPLKDLSTDLNRLVDLLYSGLKPSS
jgi:AcrR family transcriptional regulator